MVERVEFRRRASDLPSTRRAWLYFLARDGGTRRQPLPVGWPQVDHATLRALLAGAEWVHRSRGMSSHLADAGRTSPETVEL